MRENIETILLLTPKEWVAIISIAATLIGFYLKCIRPVIDNYKEIVKITKKQNIRFIKMKLAEINKNYKKDKEIPLQEEIDYLYDLWHEVEVMGDGYKEVGYQIEDARKLLQQ